MTESLKHEKIEEQSEPIWYPDRRPHRRFPHCLVIGALLVAAAFLTLKPWSAFTLWKAPKCSHRLTIEQRASKILSENPLIADGHNDLLGTIRWNYQNHIYEKDFRTKFESGGLKGHVDLPRLDEGKQGGSFWSAFVPCPSGNGTDFSDAKYSKIVKATLEQLDLYQRLSRLYPKYFTPSANSHEALKAFEKGNLISPIAIEGLHQIGNSISTLRLYHQLGVRYATLTWNCHNKFADAALESGPGYAPRVATPYWHGLSSEGRDLVKEMNRLGMLVDLAHVSKETMKDVLVGNGEGDWNGSLAPPIFSHSSAYAICPHPRNVPDDILEFVKKRKSVVMINFSPGFISCVPGGSSSGLPDDYPKNATLNQVVRHIKHVGELIGYDYVGIGTDYDGIDSTPAGLEDVSKFPDLVAELLRQGVSDEDAAKIVGRNLLRVWKEVDEVAAKLQEDSLPLEDDLQNDWSISAEWDVEL
ncbi:membrane dipeptidase-domain-containing protein [Lophiotrema nucula]|uniref:Dipeptidase n=1 Tax=Lophiotrema nucula TaxID=690887 RepID=A0A6A5YWL6_9PLEO|nr:membrane dipeptidase-domain-containing protein [Lophiotrema nucula]